ncbi:chemosensory protein 6 [Lasioglossum baleicum]|uniref:chemosensory protein 6 n=1 Tax=Lasioglossum baleicum TaxID=434251 RepID=UPI003FCD0158
MKVSLLLLALLVISVVSAGTYPNKYDDIDVERILQNGRVLTNYIKCLMDEGPCTNEGRELKKTLPDALSTDCSKCNGKQKDIAEKVINHLKNKRSRDWERLTAKYDPSGEYKKRFESTQTAKKS